MRQTSSFAKHPIAFAVAFVLLALAVLAPLASILWETVSGEGPAKAARAFADIDNLATIRNSIVLGVLVVILTTALSAPLAMLLARTPWGRSRWLDAMLLIPFMTPPYIGAMGWMLFMQRRGLLEQMVPAAKWVTPAFFSVGGLVLVMSLHLLPFMTTLMKNALVRVPASTEEAARVCGASPWRRIAKIVAPLVTGNCAIGMLLVFVKTLAEYGTPSTLGRRIGFDVFTTRIHGLATTAPVDFGSAAALSLVLITICMAAWMLQSWMTSRHTYALVGARGARVAQWRLGKTAKRLSALYIGGILLFAIGIPWFSVVATSLIKLRGFGLAAGNFTFMHYASLFTDDTKGFQALLTSLGLAASAGTLAVILGTALVMLIRKGARAGKLLEGLGLIPEMLPSIVLTLGFMLFWNRIYGWAPLYNTMGFMMLVYTTLFLPYAIQYVSSSWMQIGRSSEEAARICGARPAYAFVHVTLPLIAPGIVQGGIMIFIITLRELVAASLIAPPDVLVVSTFIVNEFEQGSASAAMAMAVICVAVTAALLALLKNFLAKAEARRMRAAG